MYTFSQPNSLSLMCFSCTVHVDAPKIVVVTTIRRCRRRQNVPPCLPRCLRVFLVDVVAITQASCAQPMNYYASMMVVCVGLKLALVLLLLGPWAWARLSACNCRATRALRAAQLHREVSAIEASMVASGRRCTIIIG